MATKKANPVLNPIVTPIAIGESWNVKLTDSDIKYNLAKCRVIKNGIEIPALSHAFACVFFADAGTDKASEAAATLKVDGIKDSDQFEILGVEWCKVDQYTVKGYNPKVDYKPEQKTAIREVTVYRLSGSEVRDVILSRQLVAKVNQLLAWREDNHYINPIVPTKGTQSKKIMLDV